MDIVKDQLSINLYKYYAKYNCSYLTHLPRTFLDLVQIQFNQLGSLID